MECNSVLGPKPFRIGCEIGCEFFIARLCGGHVLGEKFHLLTHTTANDGVVTVQAGRASFAIENLGAEALANEPLHLLFGRRAPPSASQSVFEGGKACRLNDNLRGS